MYLTSIVNRHTNSDANVVLGHRTSLNTHNVDPSDHGIKSDLSIRYSGSPKTSTCQRKSTNFSIEAILTDGTSSEEINPSNNQPIEPIATYSWMNCSRYKPPKIASKF